MIQDNKFQYLEWRSADEMHRDGLRWLSELNFIADELVFLEDLLAEYFLQLSTKQQYPEAKSLVKTLVESNKTVKSMISKVKKHMNELSILLDKEDQPYEEREVKAAHRELVEESDSYFKDFKALKKNIFILISGIMKNDKTKRLLN
ncbi:hypothetical protein [Ascidiimonas sp. W6]|uniref:hypothetical protein n=1 Tax=Ascidiimonas meishanensis TaxID=3128903 RepID=UPI0030ED101A